MTDRSGLLENIRKIVQEENAPIHKRLDEQGKELSGINKQLDALDGKVAAAHDETMKELLNIGEINYHALKQDLAALKQRVEQLETHERKFHTHHE